MPKTFYLTKEEIPADQVGCYEAKNGRYELTKLDDDHPVVSTKKDLETTQTTLKNQISTLQQEKTVAESKILPEGMVAVIPAVKELGEAAQSAGLNKKEIPTLKTKADQAEAKLKEREEADTINAIADESKLNRDAFRDHVKANGLKFETKTEKVDDKDVTTCLVITTDAAGAEVKTSLGEYLKGKGSHIAKAQSGNGDDSDDETIDIIDQEPGDKTKNTGNQFDAIRKEVEEKTKSAQATGGSFKDRFYRRNP